MMIAPVSRWPPRPCWRDRAPLPLAPSNDGVSPITDATAWAAGQLADQTPCQVIWWPRRPASHGAVHLQAAELRPYRWRERLGDDAAGACALYWGVVPVAGAPTQDNAALCNFIVQQGRAVASSKPANAWFWSAARACA